MSTISAIKGKKRHRVPAELRTGEAFNTTHIEKVRTKINGRIRIEALQGYEPISYDEILEALFSPDVLAAAKAFRPYERVVYVPAIYPLTEHAALEMYHNTSSTYTTPSEASMRPRVLPHSSPLHTLPKLQKVVERVTALRVEWGVVLAVLRRFNDEEDICTMRAVWPACMALCPDFPWQKAGLLDNPANWALPTSLVEWLPAIRASSATVARMQFAAALPEPPRAEVGMYLTLSDTRARVPNGPPYEIDLPSVTVLL